MIWFLFVSIFFLVFVAAFFSAAETSLTAVSRARIYRLAKEGKKRAQMVKYLLDSMEQLIGTILLGNNFVAILSTTVAGVVFEAWFDEGGIAITTVVMTFLLLIFAEVMPKVYGFQNAEKIVLMLAPFLVVIFKVLAPVAKGIKILVRKIWQILGINVNSEGNIKSAKEEILSLIEMYSDNQVQKEKFMLRGILDLSSVPLVDVMVHRKDLVMLNGDMPLKDITQVLSQTPYTRFPVWEKTQDNIIGVLHLRTFVHLLSEKKSLDLPIKKLLKKEPWFVPESTSLFAQLQEFRKRREHMALVIDEYGALEGIITLEDILEEIVGEISDEYDVLEKTVQSQVDGSYLVAGDMTVRDLNKQFDWSLPEEEAATLAGLLIHGCQGVPKEQETYHLHGLYIQVIKRLHHQLLWLSIKPDHDKHTF